MFEVKIGFDHKDKRFEVGDLIQKDGFSNKTWKELKDMGVIAKADLNADGKLTVSEERAFMQMDGITDDDLKNAQIKKRGEADDARKADEAEKKKNLELSLQAQDDAYMRESGMRQAQTTTTNTNETGPT